MTYQGGRDIREVPKHVFQPIVGNKSRTYLHEARPCSRRSLHFEKPYGRPVPHAYCAFLDDHFRGEDEAPE